ncbi:GNAT family N-acetyltransferase [Streptomyces sp. ESR1.13]|uniref:GNAT family N-acetyltransferase n=1 Tax=Streptomyces TaxID=1883 RepID=UPI0027E33C94|nr:GNAT family N-acetyltransferase [Streptomyces ardesiacus]
MIRRQGHSARLVGALAARILARDERPFLHVAETNFGAVAVYERTGFVTGRRVTFRGFLPPDGGVRRYAAAAVPFVRDTAEAGVASRVAPGRQGASGAAGSTGQPWTTPGESPP